MTESERTLNSAILGCGRIANRHAEHISNVGRLVSVCDIDKSRAGALADKYGAHKYYDLQGMLDNEARDIDVVSVCTPNGLHAEHTVKSLRAGCHVLCEKPMAIHSSDCGRMIHEAERSNRRLFIVKQNRFNPPVAAVKQLIDDGRLGKIYSVQLNCFWNRNTDYYRESWKGKLDLDGGCLYTQFSHFVDLLYWFIGDVVSTHALVANCAHQNTVEFEDCGVVALWFYDGTNWNDSLHRQQPQQEYGRLFDHLRGKRDH